MNKLYLTLLLSFTIIGQLLAQNQRSLPNLVYNKVYPGTVTTNDGQEIKGYVYHTDGNDFQKECIFYKNYEDRKSRKVYRPEELAGYSIENYQYKSVNYSGNLGFGKANRNFIYLAKPGAISTFIYRGDGGEQIFWKKGEDAPVSNASMFMGFKKNVLKLVGDNAELAAKIERKESGYGMLNLDKIIDEYNTWAESKK